LRCRSAIIVVPTCDRVARSFAAANKADLTPDD
jgi:hypothetical protein